MGRTRTVSRLVKRFLFEISTSRSPLESWDLFSKFLFLFSKLEKIADFSIIFCKNSRSLLEPENRSRHFSFLFSKFEIWIPYFSFSSRFHFLASLQCLLVQLKNLQHIILYWKWSHPHFALVKKKHPIWYGHWTGSHKTPFSLQIMSFPPLIDTTETFCPLQVSNVRGLLHCRFL